MNTKQFDVFCTDHPMIDYTIEVEEHELDELSLPKGIGSAIDGSQRRAMLDRFRGRVKNTLVGGSGLNTIKTLAAFGKKTAFIGTIGDDEDGARIKSTLEELGVHCQLAVRDNYPTGICICLITRDGERTMAADLGESLLGSQRETVLEYVARSRIFHFCGYTWLSPTGREVVGTAIAAGKSAKTAISFDVSDPIVVQSHREDFVNIIKHHADIVFANEEEAKSLFNHTPQEAAFSIQSLNKCAVIKLGSKGALIGNRGDQFKIAPIAVDVVDTTGAGDMFAAGFLYGITGNLPLPVAGYYGALLSTDVIKHYGATLSDDIYRQLTSKRRFIYH